MKKNDTSKAKVAVLAYSAAVAIGSMVAQNAGAATGCTSGTAATPVKCEFATGTLFASAFGFTGSNEVDLRVTSDTTGFGVCGAHARGKNSYGLTLNGGSMTVKTGTTGGSANITGGCS